MVSIRDLHFSYRRKPVFTGLSLDLRPGHIYGLLGANGTGKSTLLRNIAGLLFPQQGKIAAMGFEPGRRLPAFLQKIFLVPEELFFARRDDRKMGAV
jgi:ABC-2 type transport system ATP-binding protein